MKSVILINCTYISFMIFLLTAIKSSTSESNNQNNNVETLFTSNYFENNEEDQKKNHTFSFLQNMNHDDMNPTPISSKIIELPDVEWDKTGNKEKPLGILANNNSNSQPDYYGSQKRKILTDIQDEHPLSTKRLNTDIQLDTDAMFNFLNNDINPVSDDMEFDELIAAYKSNRLIYNKISAQNSTAAYIDDTFHRIIGMFSDIQNSCFRYCALQSIFFCDKIALYMAENKKIEETLNFTCQYKRFLKYALNHKDSTIDIKPVILIFDEILSNKKSFPLNEMGDAFDYMLACIKTFHDEEEIEPSKEKSPNEVSHSNNQRNNKNGFFTYFHYFSYMQMDESELAGNLLKNRFIIIEEYLTIDEPINTTQIIKRYFGSNAFNLAHQMNTNLYTKGKYIILNLNCHDFKDGIAERLNYSLTIDEEINVDDQLFILRSVVIFLDELRKHFVNVVLKNGQYYFISDDSVLIWERKDLEIFFEENSRYIIYEMIY